MDLLDYKTAVTIAHLLGVVVGAGGALASDFIFFSSIKDKKISRTEMRFIGLGSRMVWLGLLILVISGALLFATDPAGYLNSAKFMAKMTMIAIIIINGVIFHFVHLPDLHRHAGLHLPSQKKFIQRASFLVLSGVISLISWLSALILGSLKTVPYSYGILMLFYLLILGTGLAIGLFFKNRILPLR